MQAAERSQLRRLLSSDDFNRRRGVVMSITISICHPVPYARRWRRWNVEQSPFTVIDINCCGRRPATTLAVESPTDLFVASHWLERSSCRFPASLLIFSWADHSTSQVLTTSHVVFICTFYWRLASKACMLSDLLWLVPQPWRHTPQLIVMHVLFRSFLIIFEYAAKQAWKQLQCNKAKLLEPA